MSKPAEVVAHESKGRYVEIRAGQKVFVREQGPAGGEVVLMVHGVPSSSYLYKKFFDPLVKKGYRAISFDFPGMGLSDKPKEQDYTWGGLKDSMKLIVDKLELEDINLVIHDIGGPIAAWFAVENKDRVKRIVILNTLLKTSVFKPPFPMWTFRINYMRQASLSMFTTSIWEYSMKVLAVYKTKEYDREQAKAWMYHLFCNGGRNSFLKIMAGFELTKELEDKIREGLQDGIDLALVWGKNERSIPKAQREYVQDNFPLKMDETVVGRHFLQIDCYEEIVDFIDKFITA